MGSPERLFALRRIARALPAGVSGAGGGLLVLGVAAYGYLSIAGRALGPEAFAPLAAMWVLVNSVGPGAFQPLEQEVARAVAARRALGLGARPVLARATVLGGALISMILVLSLLTYQPLTDGIFHGNQWLLAFTLATLVGMLAEHLTRGVFAGEGHFGRYGTQLALDGFLRVLGAGVLAGFAVSTPAPFGAVLCLAAISAVIVTAHRPDRLLQPGPPARWADLSRAVGVLLAASVCSQALVNAGPLAVAVLADPEDRAATGRFLAGLVIARIPLFLMVAVQAALLPDLSRLAALSRLTELRAAVGRLLRLVVSLSLVGILGCAAMGPEIEHLLFGPGLGLGRGDLVLLGTSTGLFMLSGVLSQALIACQAYTSSALAWGSGVLLFMCSLALPYELVVRVELALIIGTAASTAVAALGFIRRLRRPLASIADGGAIAPTALVEG